MQRERIWQAGVAVALAAIVAYSFYQRWQVLTASPFPVGVDGYFYAVQVRSVLETGLLQYPASPLTFYFIAPFAAATDPITGVKLAAAIGGALIALPAYGVGVRFGRSRGAGLLAAALASGSACSMFLSIEFVKQGIGLTVALTALWLLLRVLDPPAQAAAGRAFAVSRMRITLAALGFIATLLTHKLAAGVLVLVAIPAAIEEARGRAVLRGRRLLYLLAGLAVLVIVVAVLGIAFPRRFLGPGDASLLGSLLSSHAHWTAPALATGGLTLDFDHEAAWGGLLAIAAAIAMKLSPAKPHRHGERAAQWTMVVFGLAIALPWLAVNEPQGLGFRLRIAAFVPLALNAATVIDPLLSRVKQLTARDRDLVAAGLALLFAIRPHGKPTEGMVVAQPPMVTAVMASARQIPPHATVIVPERHILFMVAWYTRAKVSLRPEPVPHDERIRMMPGRFISGGGPMEQPTPLSEAIDRARSEPSVTPPLSFHPRHRNGLVLVTEPTWEWLLPQMPPRARDWWGRWPTI